MKELPKEGAVFRIAYPFVRDTYIEQTEDGSFDRPTWKPGVRWEDTGPYGEDTEAFADGVGEMVLTVVSVHKPSHYPVRVFFTRTFATPDGRLFGKSGLRMTTADAFCRRSAGYRDHFTVVA